ncbi:hypothetical protein [Streptomyces sp. GC420]|uniref:hypothetical protein n=1 Tax=Streptomyces sp. GC420 TaxID=2697568 RepID=UPI00141513BC|nr:hypothetical protein [Streptomyces sp. GC420]NBM20817.1 hypothetical protein [Streptomyces sp. GC420]
MAYTDCGDRLRRALARSAAGFAGRLGVLAWASWDGDSAPEPSDGTETCSVDPTGTQ